MSGSRYYGGGDSNYGGDSYNRYESPRDYDDFDDDRYPRGSTRPVRECDGLFPPCHDCPRVAAARERARALQLQQQERDVSPVRMSQPPVEQRYYAQQRYLDERGVQHTLQMQYTRSGPGTGTGTGTAEQRGRYAETSRERESVRYPAEPSRTSNLLMPRDASPPYTSARSSSSGGVSARPSSLWEPAPSARTAPPSRFLLEAPQPPDTQRLAQDAGGWAAGERVPQFARRSRDYGSRGAGDMEDLYCGGSRRFF
ncbi:uncharacterized protein K452DRAFT_291984 [Aplosporella prunicola CBS 121167]|uniref:Uncharacterized protein n=1 Tax=Aplosporella prunicola CBS 121167 TaxID=1176127 RepID=A0A6A6B2J5_9PEZI|nr:uncharacterized protein K452DRAFT_291984 [Aplosporella prunicola CBS 121167]KAF2136951.1 hypothetical protein K452DRAFT_291984 [Aplosporella prunicola CBS 121167]